MLGSMEQEVICTADDLQLPYSWVYCLQPGQQQILAQSPAHSQSSGGEARIGAASNGLLALEFLRQRGDAVAGSSSLKRTGSAGLVGPQRCRLKRHIWEPLAELK